MKYLLIPIIAIFSSCYSTTSEKKSFENKPLPSFSLLLPDSTTYFNTNSIPQDKPVLLMLFGPKCPYSKAQMEELIEDIDQLKNVRIFVFTPFPFNEMKEFYKHYNLNQYSNITVGLDYRNFASKFFEIEGVPFIAIYNKNKLFLKSFNGKTRSKQIKQFTEQ